MFETLMQAAAGFLPNLRWWGGGYYGGPGYGMMGWYSPFWMIFHGLFWIVVIALVIWAVVRLSKSRTIGGAGTPLDILKRRLASGEVTAEEFAKIKKALDDKR
jgi:putative membrane protein